MKKILLLGAGLVSKPLVRYLLKQGFSVTVASRTFSKAQALLDGHPHGRAQAWTVDDQPGSEQQDSFLHHFEGHANPFPRFFSR